MYTNFKDYIRNFDGVRAFAILPVMLLHGSYGIVKGGMVGVDLFFVLSGYLITSLLIREFQDQHDISLRRFYARRFLRLYPALLTVTIVTIFAWNAFPVLDRANPFIAAAAPLLYFANLVPAQMLGPLSHCWSLSVEEHFYFFWPPVLVFFLRCNRLFSLAVMVFAIAGFSLVLRICALKYHLLSGGLDAYRITPCRLDAIMVGSGLSIVAELYPASFRRLFDSRIILYLGLSMLILITAIFDVVAYQSWIRSAAMLVCCVSIVSSAACVSSQWLLSNCAAQWLGRRSYGIYLYHLPIFEISDRLRVPHSSVNFLWVSALRFAITFLVAEVSYRIIETPFLRLKHRFDPAMIEPPEGVPN